MTDVVAVILLVIDVLEEFEIPYFLSGSFASSSYGSMRLTHDADIVAALDPGHINPFVDRLESEFYLDKKVIQKAILQLTGFNLIHLKTAFKVDIFLPGNQSFDKRKFERREMHIIDRNSKRKTYFASPEDTILSKLLWYQMGDAVSEVQWRDVQGILRQRYDLLDMDYLKVSALELGVASLLEKSLAELRRE